MNGLVVDASVWAEMRFDAFRNSMKWNKAEALGALALFWGNTRGVYASARITRAQALDALTFCVKPKKVLSALEQSGYVHDRQEVLLVVDNEQHYERAERLRVWGKKGGFHAHKKAAKKENKASKNAAAMAKQHPTLLTAQDQIPASRAAWDAYAEAYRARYGVEPLRNSKVNGQMAHFVKQVGKDAAAAVAHFYLRHNGEVYVRAQHDVGSMLRDASGLHTQMLRREEVNEQTVRMLSERKRFEAQLQSINAAY